MAASPSLPCDVLPCPGGDVIIVPRGQLTIRLTPDQRRTLATELLEMDRESADG
jgi:hypothetical protein